MKASSEIIVNVLFNKSKKKNIDGNRCGMTDFKCFQILWEVLLVERKKAALLLYHSGFSTGGLILPLSDIWLWHYECILCLTAGVGASD